MKAIEYEKLMTEIMPLDISTLTRLETDLVRLIQQRRAEKSGERRSIMELAALAGESLHGLESEHHPSFFEPVRPFFEALERGDLRFLGTLSAQKLTMRGVQTSLVE